MAILSRAIKITGDEEVFQGNALLQIQSGNYWQNVGHYEHIGFIGGKPGTMKSTILRYFAAAWGGNYTPFGFRFNPEPGQRIAWFDGEQPRDIVVGAVNHIRELGGVDTTDYLDMFELNGILLPVDRRRELWRIIYQVIAPNKSHGLIIIDGMANFLDNINNFDEVNQFMNCLTTVAKQLKVMIIVLSHLASDGDGGQKLFGSGGTRLSQLASFGWFMSAYGPYFVMDLTKGRYGFVAPKIFRFGKEKNILLMEPYCPF